MLYCGQGLGLLIDSDLKFSSHIEAMVTKAHQRSSLILRCFKCMDPVLLYRAFDVRPILEYNAQFGFQPILVSYKQN